MRGAESGSTSSPTAAASPAPTPTSDVVKALDAARGKRLDAQWSCKVFAANTSSALDPKTTVGVKFTLACEGAVAPKLDVTKMQLELPEAQKYSLHVLETRALTDARGEFLVTSWRAGEIKLNNPILTDGVSRIGLGEIDFTIASVVDPKANPPPQPFPPFGALKMPLPNWVFIGAGLVILLVVGVIAERISRNLRRKSLLRLLEKNPIALTPFHQLNKDLRKLARSIPNDTVAWDQEVSSQYVKELDEDFKWFLSRELVIPSFERSAKELSRDIERALGDRLPTREAETFQRDLRVTLGELEKARRIALDPAKKTTLVTVADAQQLTELVRTLADQIHDASGEGKKKVGAR